MLMRLPPALAPLMLAGCYDWPEAAPDSGAARMLGAELACEDSGLFESVAADAMDAGSDCACVTASAADEWSGPLGDGPCAEAKDQGIGPCATDAMYTWSRRCFIDAYVIACCEAAAEAGCPCGGEAP